jgi:hypothetical protein
MPDVLTGWVHGNTIRLEASVPPLEGKRVLVWIEPAEDLEAALTPDVQARLGRRGWRAAPRGRSRMKGDPSFRDPPRRHPLVPLCLSG